MKITITLSTTESSALQRFMADYDMARPEDALASLTTDWLITMRYIEPIPEMDEDTETVGEA